MLTKLNIIVSHLQKKPTTLYMVINIFSLMKIHIYSDFSLSNHEANSLLENKSIVEGL